MKTVLITGASGFVGSFIVEACINAGFKTLAAIRKTSSTRYLNLDGVNLVYLNLNNKNELKHQLQEIIQKHGNVHYVVHNAGITKAKRTSDFYEHNYQTTVNLVDTLHELNITIEKFIYMSSLAAWGPGNPNTLEPIRLSDKPMPNTEYGKSKLLADEYVRTKHQLPWIILRPTGIYGPRDVDYLAFFKTIRRGLEPYIGFKQQYLTFIYVKDLAQLIVKALNSDIVHRAYFVSDGKVYTSEEFSQITKHVLHQKTIKIRVPLTLVKIIVVLAELLYKPLGRTPVLNKDKYNILSATNWKCEVELLVVDFNFEAHYDLTKGVADTISWYKEQRWLE